MKTLAEKAKGLKEMWDQKVKYRQIKKKKSQSRTVRNYFIKRS